LSADTKKIYIFRLLGILAILLAGGLVYYLFSPEQSDFFPRCPFHVMTGLDCPGCGSQRAIHHILHFEIGKAFMSNALLIIAIPYIIVCTYLEYFGGKERYPRLRKMIYSKNAVISVLILIILFWILRNIF